MTKALFIGMMAIITTAFAAPLPDLPGQEITEAERAQARSSRLVEPPQESAHSVSHWTAPGIEEQLSQDETLIGMGQGAIFVPKMTESRLEPEILVVDETGEKSWFGRTGLRIVLDPGTYTVRLGSGSFKQQSIYKAIVQEGKTTLISPTWGGLVITTLSEDGDLISADYEIFSLKNGESFGKGFGLTSERQNDIRTWLLPPGLYRISRSGEDFGSLLNYITVQANSGELTHVELIFESPDLATSTGRLIAGGVRPVQSRNVGDSYWNLSMRIGGTASYSTVVTKSERTNNVWNTIGDLRIRARYDRFRWFGLIEVYDRTNLQWLDQEDEPADLTVVQDLFQLQNAWVYRLRDWVGPYARVNLKTHLWPEYRKLSDFDSTLYVSNANGDTIATYNSNQKVLITPRFFPLRVGEGTGLNFQVISINALEVSAQTGLAWRQIYLDGVKQSKKASKTLYGPADDVFDFGWENSLTARVRLWRFLTLDLVGELFLPNARPSQYQVEELSADLRLALTRFLEISYQQELQDRAASGLDDTEGGPRFKSLNTVQLRLYLNF